MLHSNRPVFLFLTIIKNHLNFALFLSEKGFSFFSVSNVVARLLILSRFRVSYRFPAGARFINSVEFQ